MPLTSEDIATRIEAEDLVIQMFVATDERDGATLEACFMDPFVLDMSSMVGGSPVSMTPRQVASAWADGFKPLTHVHHQIGNMRTNIANGAATVRCYGVALHHRSTVVTDANGRAVFTDAGATARQQRFYRARQN